MSPRRGQRGFTLIEAVIALAVVAMSLAAIGDVANVTVRSAVHVERHLAEVETARTLLAIPPSRDEIARGTLKGEMAGQAFRFDAEPYRAAFFAPAPGAKWVPAKVRLRVQGPGGAVLDLDMIRLIRAAGQ